MFAIHSVKFCLIAVLIAFPTNEANPFITKRKGLVRIRNEFGEPIYGVKIIHKYSNIYVDQFEWKSVENGVTTPSNGYALYHTGIFTTGRDWWKVFWVAKGGLYTTNPNNFREAIDFLEEIWDKIDEGVIGAAGAALVAATGGAATPVAAAAAVVLTSSAIAVSGGVTAPGSTVGFKQHILRESDEKQPLTITIRKNEVIFSSPSGVSTTNGIDRKALPKPRS